MTGRWRIIEPGDYVLAVSGPVNPAPHFATVIELDTWDVLVQWPAVVWDRGNRIDISRIELVPRRQVIIVAKHDERDAAA